MSGILLVIISAVMLGLSRLPLYTGCLGFIGMIPLLMYFDKGYKNWKVIFRDAFVFAAIYFTLWMHWMWGVTSGGFLGIILLYAIYYFVIFLLIQFIWQRQPKLKYIGFILIFVCYEYIQNLGEFRFPWTDLGYALSDYTVLIQAADIGGIALLSLLMLIINVFFYLVMQKKRLYLAAIAIIMLFWTGYGIWCMKTLKLTQSDHKIAIMQPSIPQEEKWETAHFDELYQRYTDLTRQAAQDSVKLIIWPEAAMPAYILRDPGYRPLVQNLCDDNNIEIFTGFPDILPAPAGYPGGEYYYNAATLFGPNRHYDEPYYKMIVVPVGERIPLLNVFPFLWKLQFGQANWEYGSRIHYYQSNGVTFSPQICFEIAFPEINRDMAFRNLGDGKQGKPDKIDCLVNLTNDAWYGRSSGPWIHGMLTKFRAVENRIQIYRSANTGISMAVDPLGRIINKTKLFDITLLKSPLYKSTKVPMFYWLYDWARYACLLTFLLLLYALFKPNKNILKPRGNI
jgi:apolipoprotein N-acyltransferase